jgi:hypothetical protein
MSSPGAGHRFAPQNKTGRDGFATGFLNILADLVAGPNLFVLDHEVMVVVAPLLHIDPLPAAVAAVTAVIIVAYAAITAAKAGVAGIATAAYKTKIEIDVGFCLGRRGHASGDCSGCGESDESFAKHDLILSSLCLTLEIISSVGHLSSNASLNQI